MYPYYGGVQQTTTYQQPGSCLPYWMEIICDIKGRVRGVSALVWIRSDINDPVFLL